MPISIKKSGGSQKPQPEKKLDLMTAVALKSVGRGESMREAIAKALEAVESMDATMLEFYLRTAVRLQPKVVKETMKYATPKLGSFHPHEPGCVTAWRRTIRAIVDGEI